MKNRPRVPADTGNFKPAESLQFRNVDGNQKGFEAHAPGGFAALRRMFREYQD